MFYALSGFQANLPSDMKRARVETGPTDGEVTCCLLRAKSFSRMQNYLTCEAPGIQSPQNSTRTP